MAWRYNASANHGNTGVSPSGGLFVTSNTTNTNNSSTNGSGGNRVFGGGGSSSPFGRTPGEIFNAGAFLRSNAVSAFGERQPRPQSDDDTEDEELMTPGEESLVQNGGRRSMGATSINVPDFNAPAVFGRSQAETRSVGSAFIRKVAQRGDNCYASSLALGGSKSMWANNLEAFLPPQKLFGQMAALSNEDEDEGEERGEYDDSVMMESARNADRAFIRSTKALFAEVDRELLSDSFVPYEHVLQVIATEDGTEATADAIDRRLVPYYELQRELDALLLRYIEAHHDEFNETISGFSELILTVSGGDETLAQLKQQLIMAAVSLDNRAEQLQALRLRAARALLMAESLKGLEASLSCEREVRLLIDTHHYLAAMRLLRSHKERLQTPEIADIRVTQHLRDYVNVTLDTLHMAVLDELMNCVFRKRILSEADAQMVDRMLLNGASNNAIAATTALAKICDDVQAYKDSAGEHTGMTLADVVEHMDDDPCNDKNVFKNYLRFIPLCVKTLKELGKLDRCYEAFLSSATHSIGQSVAHFLDLYGRWRQRREVSLTSVSEGDDGATVHATKLQGKEIASAVMSHDEGIALVQQPELRTMLDGLLVELEKIVRNTDYLIKVVLVAYFPFLSTCLMQHGSFDPERTYRSWDVSHTPLRNVDVLREIVTTALATVLSECGEAEAEVGNGGESAAMLALKRLVVKLDVDNMLAAVGKKGGCLHHVLEAIDEAAQAAQQECSVEDEIEEVNVCRRRLGGQVTSMVLQVFRLEVKEIHTQWDMQVLSSQLSYYVELVFHVLCDAKEVHKDSGDEVALKLFLKHGKGLVNRVQRVTEIMSGSGVDTFATLDKMLSAHEPSGVLSVMEQTGRVSFSLVEAVKCVRQESKRASESQMRRTGAGLAGTTSTFTAGGGTSLSSIAGGRTTSNSGEVLVLKQATALKKWFVLSPMNILTCYECTQRFFKRCSDRAPRFANGSQDELKEFFHRFLQTTYVPTLYTFHTQQLRWLLDDMSESDKFASEAVAADGVNKLPMDSLLNGRFPTEPVVHRQKAQLGGIRWSAVTVRQGKGSGYPVLACVHYVGQVLQKVARICRTLSGGLMEEVRQHIAERLLTELALFLKKKLQRITYGSLSYHLLNADFEDAFFGRPTWRWRALCDEKCLRAAHDCVDVNLFRYYAHNNRQRTSGHQHNSHSGLGVSGEMLGFGKEENGDYDCGGGGGGGENNNNSSADFSDFDPCIASAPASELALKGDGVAVALALLCHSTEWLCDIALETFAPAGWKCNGGAECLVPGAAFLREYEHSGEGMVVVVVPREVFDGTSRRHLLGSVLRQVYALSQACLFHLSVEARFVAFQFIPQLRDESYNVVVTTHTADTFVQAYNQRITNFFALLRLHLSARKLKYISITVAKPLSNLVMVEMAHLRDKVISPAGLTRLQLNLLSMEATLQLVLPTDDDVREAVKHFFARPATFIRYLPNKDVTNDLVASGDYRYFTVQEMEELVRLVFRLESENDTVAQQIQLLRVKLRGVNPARTAPMSAPADRAEDEEKGGLVLQPVSTQATRHADPNSALVTSCLPAANDEASLRGMRLPSAESEEEEDEEEEETGSGGEVRC